MTKSEKKKKKGLNYVGIKFYDRSLTALVLEHQGSIGYTVNRITKQSTKFEGDYSSVYHSLRRDDPQRGYKSLTKLFLSKGKEVEIRSVSTSASYRILEILQNRPSLKETRELKRWKREVFTELREKFMVRDGINQFAAFFRVVDLLESSEYYLKRGFYKVRTPECLPKETLPEGNELGKSGVVTCSNPYL